MLVDVPKEIKIMKPFAIIPAVMFNLCSSVPRSKCRIAVGMGVKVTVLDFSVERLHQSDDVFENDIHIFFPTL